MPTAISRFTPTDYDRRHAVHLDSMRTFGRQLGIVSEVIYRDRADPKTVMVVQTVHSIETLTGFMMTPEFQAIVSEAAFVEPPQAWFVDSPIIVDVAALWT